LHRPNYGFAVGAGDDLIGAIDGEFGSRGAAGRTLIVGGVVALADPGTFDGPTVGGVAVFADFRKVRNNRPASIAA